MDLQTTFTTYFHRLPELLARAPGRVNLLGEHVDYNEGLVLPAAIDRAVQLAAAPLGDETIHLFALDLDQSVAFRLADLEARRDLDGRPLPGWALYPAGVAWSLREAGLPVCGMEAVYTSDIPIGAGLSSSAAVEVAFAATWQTLAGGELDRMLLARLCQRAENRYVGVNSGLMDQFASAHGVEGHALYFDTRSLEWAPEPLPPGTAIVVADSGVRHSHSTSGYNDRRAACEAAVEELRNYLPNIHSLRDVSPQEFVAYSAYLPDEIRKRAEHVVKEIARVESAVNALHRQDTRAFGALMYAGHASLRDLYEVSVPEIDTLVSLARKLPGVIGARLTGGGFGGCTVNLVEADKAPAFIKSLQDGYQAATGRQAQVYLCRASNGVNVGPPP
jgi:galactokinase